MTRLFLLPILLSTPVLACTSANGVPDPLCTPGAIDPAVTQVNIHETICVLGYSKSVRPPLRVTYPLKRQVMEEYGLEGKAPRLFEGDPLIPIEIGGCPGPDRDCDFHANYWPQAWAEPNGAHDKDRIENALHRLVCSDRMPLAEAQHRLSTDWRHALDDQGEGP